jgi:hypothetical protein
MYFALFFIIVTNERNYFRTRGQNITRDKWESQMGDSAESKQPTDHPTSAA